MRKAFAGLLALFLTWTLPGDAALAETSGQKAGTGGKSQSVQKGKSTRKDGASAKGKSAKTQSAKTKSAKSGKDTSGKGKSTRAKSTAAKTKPGKGKPAQAVAGAKGRPDKGDRMATSPGGADRKNGPSAPVEAKTAVRPADKPADRPASAAGDGKPSPGAESAKGPAPGQAATRTDPDGPPAVAAPVAQAPDAPFGAGKMAMPARPEQAPRLGSSLVGPALATLAVAAAAGPEPAQAAARPGVAPPPPIAVTPPAVPSPVPAAMPSGASLADTAASPPTRTASAAAKPVAAKPASAPAASTKPRAAVPVCMPRDEALLGRRVMATVEWSPDYGTDLLCVASGGAGEAKRLECMALKKLNGVESVCLTDLVHEDFDWPLALYPLGDLNAHLLTVWAAGSAYHVRVFGVQDGKLKVLVDDGSRRFPEVVAESSGEMGIIVTDYAAGPPGARTATLSRHYRWNGRLYDVTEAVPGRRFDKVR